ncbi:MAG TPA: hypothetical protein VHB21_06500, partial [Minicystis sp.]|nr:hypothetical protein [Minicystis sp.]
MSSPLVLCVLGGAAALAAAPGCGSGAQCGPGTVESGDTCVVANGGAGGATSSSSSSSSGTTGGGGAGGSAKGAPQFAGVASISPASTTSLLLVWDAATDDQTPAGDIRYAVYLSKDKGGEHYGSPDAIVQH